MATTVERSGALRTLGARAQADGPHPPQSDAPRCSTRTRSRAARACSPRAGRSSSTPASTPAARRRTSSSCASPARRTASGGATSTAELAEEKFVGLRDKVVAYLERAAGALRRRRVRRRRPRASDRRARDHRPPVPRALREDAVHRADATTSSTTFEADALVLHAPALEAEPEEDGTRSGTFVVAAPDAHGGADRRHVLRGRDQEVDLHGDERPAAARGRPADALLGERRRRRPRRGLLRALRARARRRSPPIRSAG